MTNPLYTISQFPADSQAAMREFDDRYLAMSLAAPPPSWISMLGADIPTNAPMTTFPVSAFALKYLQTEGESRYKKLLNKSFDVKVQEFDAGYQGNLLGILSNSFEYGQWRLGPEVMKQAEYNHVEDNIVTLLEAGASTLWGASLANPLGIDGVNFFSASHLSDFTNPSSTTWSNYQSTPKDPASVTNISAEATIMRGVLDANGRKLNVEPDTIVVPTAKFEAVSNYLAKELVLENGTGSAAVTNTLKGRYKVLHAPGLTDADDWYLVDSKLAARLPPFMSMKYMIPESSGLALRWYLEDSDFFKDTGEIKCSSHIWYGFSLGFPQSIRLVKGA